MVAAMAGAAAIGLVALLAIEEHRGGLFLTTEDNGGHSLGPCCVCNGTDGVLNLIMLDRRAAISGHGWGCLICDLPFDGAYAVMCDPCWEKYRADETVLQTAC